jgi:acetyl esterase/lipase
VTRTALVGFSLATVAVAHPSGVVQKTAAHLRLDSTVEDVLTHQAFQDFGRLFLPWDDQRGGPTRLRDIESLLPYHSHIAPGAVLGALNRMIDDAGSSATVFYDVYTPEQKASDPSRRRTGLFFLRGTPGAPFALIAPGGGFSYVASLHEGFPYAVEINRAGYNAFVLKYRVGEGGAPATQDMAAALAYVVRNAETLGVGRRNYSLWGSSAGARMAAAIGSNGTARFGFPAPSAIVMAYTGHTDIGPADPPTFAVVGERDTIASPATMERRVAALRRQGTEVQFRKYPGVGHGFGLGIGTSAAGWVEDAIGFWTCQNERERR